MFKKISLSLRYDVILISMKRLLLFVIPFVCLQFARGQGGDGQYLQKCLINPKTGDTIRQTFWRSVDVSGKYLLNMRLTRTNSIYTMEFRYRSACSRSAGFTCFFFFLPSSFAGMVNASLRNTPALLGCKHVGCSALFLKYFLYCCVI